MNKIYLATGAIITALVISLSSLGVVIFSKKQPAPVENKNVAVPDRSEVISLIDNATSAFSTCSEITFISATNTGDGTPWRDGTFSYKFFPANARCFAQPATSSTKP